MGKACFFYNILFSDLLLPDQLKNQLSWYCNTHQTTTYIFYKIFFVKKIQKLKRGLSK